MTDLTFPESIVACATPQGQGGIGIVRVSGSAVPMVAERILGKIPKPRYAHFCDFVDEKGSTIDQGLAFYFKAPHSFTGEDVLELHGHGSPMVVDFLISEILKLGVRLAKPGEFSERAFLNNKIDLIQAEAIADLIEASSFEAAKSAMKSLQGNFSREIRLLNEDVIRLRMYVEAAIDFPEEEIDFLSDGKVLEQLKKLQSRLDIVLDQAKQGRALREGLVVVIAGHPNAGKSSLLNRLTGVSSAIVSDTPGTTRDVIRETVLLDGIPIQIMDTAGLRETSDSVEFEGVSRAWSEVEKAERILLVVDAKDYSIEKLCEHPLLKKFNSFKEKLTLVRNKIDLTEEDPAHIHQDSLSILNVSAKNGEGLSLIKKHLKECLGYHDPETVFLARRRHLEALNRVKGHFESAHQQLVVYQAGELMAEELLLAQNALSEITGEFRSDDLLSQIFSSFCIGK